MPKVLVSVLSAGSVFHKMNKLHCIGSVVLLGATGFTNNLSKKLINICCCRYSVWEYDIFPNIRDNMPVLGMDLGVLYIR